MCLDHWRYVGDVSVSLRKVGVHPTGNSETEFIAGVWLECLNQRAKPLVTCHHDLATARTERL